MPCDKHRTFSGNDANQIADMMSINFVGNRLETTTPLTMSQTTMESHQQSNSEPEDINTSGNGTNSLLCFSAVAVRQEMEQDSAQ